MQPQAAWLVVVVVAVVTLGVQVHALTAFGKSNSPDKETKPVPKTPRGRLCTTPADCAGTPGTTCILEKQDGKKHCLCRNGAPPINGKCEIILIEPGKTCNEHSECVINAECTAGNETTRKTCTCKKGYDWLREIDDSACSGCSAMWPCFLTILVTLAVLLITEPRANVASS